MAAREQELNAKIVVFDAATVVKPGFDWPSVLDR